MASTFGGIRARNMGNRQKGKVPVVSIPQTPVTPIIPEFVLPRQISNPTKAPAVPTPATLTSDTADPFDEQVQEISTLLGLSFPTPLSPVKEVSSDASTEKPDTLADDEQDIDEASPKSLSQVKNKRPNVKKTTSKKKATKELS